MIFQQGRPQREQRNHPDEENKDIEPTTPEDHQRDNDEGSEQGLGQNAETQRDPRSGHVGQENGQGVT